ncbi:hypothetical protein [Neobacillus kokaensis]|uniref:Uncharacterized protein n=1 Tax=Neobacillus kokaensis TaxID=2759023 RepID=A0ABQ3MYT5_9BACI|nr:hypothetical protein [Neobacillus kokaensis]GHH96913.1 hypothetical protein AM1BK_04560 [Neobacillus kokaensis]
MAKKKHVSSLVVDQKKLLNDKVEAAREDNFKNNQIRKVTQNGADGQ